MSIVTDFKSIRRKLERQEQKAEYEADNPAPEPSMYGWPYGVAVPFVTDQQVQDLTEWLKAQPKPAGVKGCRFWDQSDAAVPFVAPESDPA